VDNAIDEFIMGYGKEVEIKIEGNRVSVRDFGRGIPLGKVVDCVSKINTGAKYNDEVFQFSVGLNGVGTKAVNALSKTFLVRSHRDGEFAEAQFKIGKLKKEAFRQDEGAERHVHRVRAGPGDFQGQRIPAGIHRAAAAALQLSEHGAEADFENAGAGRAQGVSVAQRPDGPGDGGSGQATAASRFIRRCITRARRWSSASRTATAATARRFIPSSTASTPAMAARI
jgi:hypothetical protein